MTEPIGSGQSNLTDVEVLLDMCRRNLDGLRRAVEENRRVEEWFRYLRDDLDRLDDAVHGRPLRPVVSEVPLLDVHIHQFEDPHGRCPCGVSADEFVGDES